MHAAFAVAYDATMTKIDGRNKETAARQIDEFVFALGTHGGASSALVGDVQGVSNLEAPATVRLEEAWLQENLFDNRLSWLVGCSSSFLS